MQSISESPTEIISDKRIFLQFLAGASTFIRDDLTHVRFCWSSNIIGKTLVSATAGHCIHVSGVRVSGQEAINALLKNASLPRVIIKLSSFRFSTFKPMINNLGKSSQGYDHLARAGETAGGCSPSSWEEISRASYVLTDVLQEQLHP